VHFIDYLYYYLLAVVLHKRL